MSRDYTVGYKRPPVATRFAAGRSGNPAGRPRDTHTRTLDAAITAPLSSRQIVDAANRTMTMVENGERVTVASYDAVVLSLAQCAMRGDLKAIAEFLDLVLRAECAQANRQIAAYDAQPREVLVGLGAFYDSQRRQREEFIAERRKVLGRERRKAQRAKLKEAAKDLVASVVDDA